MKEIRNSPLGSLTLTDVVKNLLIINCLFFVATMILATKFDLGDSFRNLTDFLGLHYWASPKFKPFQVITHMFTHGGWMHIGFNMFGLVMFGAPLEQMWGPRKFLFFYLFCGLGSAALHMASNAFMMYNLAGAFEAPNMQFLIDNQEALSVYATPAVGASGALYGLLAAFGLKFPDVKLMLIFFPVPIKAKYFILILFAIDLFLGIQNYDWDFFAHFAHLGGMIAGFLLLLFWREVHFR